jgi:hypothetical protein
MFLLLSIIPMELSQVSHAYEISAKYSAGVVILGCQSAAFGTPMVLVASRLRTHTKAGGMDADD